MKVSTKLFKDLFTGKDKDTYDIGRILWFQVTQAYILFSGYSLYKTGVFDPITWGGGVAALLGAGGAALGFKSMTEPDADGDGIPDKFQQLERGKRRRTRREECEETVEVTEEPDDPKTPHKM